jgi:hypothetical protein
VANHLIIFKIYYLLRWVKPITITYETLKTSQFSQEGLVYIKVLFSPSTIRLWNNLPTDLRNSPCQQMFKNEIRKVYDIPDKPPLYFSTGIRNANILHARLRQKFSSLKCDLFRCNLIASCNCDCGNYIESVDHFFLKCNIYTEHRIQLFRGMSNLGFDINIENILFGNASFENDKTSKLFLLVQKYIVNSKRFVQ